MISDLLSNPAQQILDEAVRKQMASEGKKGDYSESRQQGLSTYVGGYLYFQFHKRQRKKPWW